MSGLLGNLSSVSVLTPRSAKHCTEATIAISTPASLTLPVWEGSSTWMGAKETPGTQEGLNQGTEAGPGAREGMEKPG
jgi:hypothetical protein